MLRPFAVGVGMFGLAINAGCDDPCLTQPSPTVEIGRLVGAAGFEPFEDGDEVQLGFAPQGGSGVFATLRTMGMSAHEQMIIFPRTVTTQLVIEGVDGSGAVEVMGDFQLTPSIYCVDNAFGLVTNAVFGVDPALYDSEESVAGRAVTLKVDVEDENGARASASADVVFASMQ
ncbi:MAG: hypothetical protein HYS27_06365 [Deltaproteobacteria bacterium]|nr:hypothetical protein [Deltaproteobacteria bacterium]